MPKKSTLDRRLIGTLSNSDRVHEMNRLSSHELFKEYYIATSRDLEIFLDGELLKQTNSVKYLGVHLTGAPNENIVQSHLNIALLNAF